MTMKVWDLGGQSGRTHRARNCRDAGNRCEIMFPSMSIERKQSCDRGRVASGAAQACSSFRIPFKTGGRWDGAHTHSSQRTR